VVQYNVGYSYCKEVGTSMPSRTNIQPTTVRLSDEGKRLLALLAADMGVNRSAVIEILIRAEAERKGLR
jgi:hypothetical protein